MRSCTVLVLALVIAAIVPASAVRAASAPVPAHVRTWVYYGGVHQNEDVPADWMAQHTDFAEADAGQPEIVERFKHAGGRYAVMYTDPAYVPYCHPPFAPPAGRCDGPIGNRELPESAWLHGLDGQRVHRPAGDLFQEALNPADPAARDAYHRFTLAAAEKAPGVDLFFADDSGSTLRGGDHTSMSGLFYRFNAPGVEFGDIDDRFVDAERAMLAAAARPVILNGGDPESLLPAYDGAFLLTHNVAGATLEGCFVAAWFREPVSDAKNLWVRQADALLAIERRQRAAVCLQQGPLLHDPQARLYGLASWWLIDDGRNAVIGLLDGGVDGHAPFAEEALVPRGPSRSAARIVQLRDAHGAYIREFAACSYALRPLGPCAAMVNPSAVGTAPLPAGMRRYHRSLALDPRSAFAGGVVHFTDGVPAALPPISAAIVFR